MVKGRLQAYSIVIFTLIIVLLVVFFWNSIVGITGYSVAVSEPAVSTSIEEIISNFDEFRNKEVIIDATVTDERTGGFSKIIDNKGNEFLINADLPTGTYEITGTVRKQASLYYRYYRIDHYIDINSYEKI